MMEDVTSNVLLNLGNQIIELFNNAHLRSIRFGPKNAHVNTQSKILFYNFPVVWMQIPKPDSVFQGSLP